jgi:predicted TIM-barrel fold metal-dependent hydrolase
MDKHGIETSIISRTSGETEEGGERGRAFARKSNEFAAKVVSDNQKRFGFFANIPYSDLEGALKELEYAYETLKADGVSLLSSIGDKWPGDPAFDPGIRGTQPPQGDFVLASVNIQMLPQSHSGGRGFCRARLRHDPRRHESPLFRDTLAASGYPLHH